MTSKNVMAVLSVCMALQITSYVMVLPLFARRFSELGAGVNALGISSTVAALTGALAAPFMGALADRFGRRRLALVSLAISILATTGYCLVTSSLALILLRGLGGMFIAGLVPAVTGIIADLAPQERRAQWIGILNGGASVGWIAGPILGGVMYDHWGYGAAVVISAITGLLAFLISYLTVPETRREDADPADSSIRKTGRSRLGDIGSTWRSFRNTLPASIPVFAVLLWIYFAVMFAWAFIEPSFMFHAYDTLGWSSSTLGLMMSTFGVAMALGEFGLSQLSDRLGRKPVIIIGLVFFSAQFLGIAISNSYILIAASFMVAGFGNALFDPALSASLLDIAPAKHQSRILGIKSTAGSLGSILGPSLVILFTSTVNARGIFFAAAGVVCLTVLAGLAAKFETRGSRKISVL
jgi:MFS family permease